MYIYTLYIYIYIIDILSNLVYIVFNSTLTFCKIIFPAQGGSREGILGARTNLQFARLSQSKKGQCFLISRHLGVSGSQLSPYIGRCYTMLHLWSEVRHNATSMEGDTTQCHIYGVRYDTSRE